MATVGAVFCDFLHGSASQPQARIQTWETPGIDGLNAQTLGLGPGPFEYRAVRYGSLSTIVQWISDIAGTAGSFVTIVDDHGTSISNAFIESVVVTEKKGIYYPQNPAVTHRAEALVRGRTS